MTNAQQFLGTDLLDLMGDVLLAHEVVTAPAKVVSTTISNEVLEVENLLNSMVEGMFKDCKTATNFDEVLNKYAYELDKLNRVIRMNQIVLKPQGAYLRGYWNGIQVFYISLGNAKLQANEHGEGFAIWSIVGKITCNGKTDICASGCYNVCRSYEKTIKTKIRNAIFTQLDAFVPTMVKAIKGMTYEKTYFRIHEDGDFFNGEYFTKWLEIAKELENENVVLMAYTKDTDILPQIKEINKNRKNMVLRYSIMEDTKQDIKDYVKQAGVPTYICIGKTKKSRDAKKIFKRIALPNRCMDNCKYCKKCYIKHDSLNLIFTKMH